MKKTIAPILLLTISLTFTSCGTVTPPMNNSAMSGMAMGNAMSVSSEKDFLLMMIPHHQEAIDASTYMLTRNPSSELKTFLEGVVSDQSREVETMKEWLKAWYGIANLPENTYMPMMPRLDNLSDQDAAGAYMEGMIGHHNGAIEMAKRALDFNEHPQMKNFARGIMSIQTKEVRELQLMKGRLNNSGTGALMRNR